MKVVKSPFRFFLIAVSVTLGATAILWALFGQSAATQVVPYLGAAGIAVALIDNHRRAS